MPRASSSPPPDARKDVAEAHHRLLEKVGELPALRQELLAARELLQWVASYPERPESFGYPSAAALGLQAPLKATLGLTARLEFSALLAAFEEDAKALATAFGAETKRRLGDADAATPLTEAMWSEDPRAKEWGRQELERARRLAEWQDPNQLGREVSDLRP